MPLSLPVVQQLVCAELPCYTLGHMREIYIALVGPELLDSVKLRDGTGRRKMYWSLSKIFHHVFLLVSLGHGV